MTPLGAVCLGFLLVLIDLRTPGLDVVPDPLGWVFVVAGLSRLARLDPRFRRVRQVAVLSGLLSLADLVHPVLTQTTGAGTTSAAVEPSGIQGWLVTGYIAADVITAVLLSLAIRDRARAHGDLLVAQRFALFVWLHVGFGALALTPAPIRLVTDVADVAVLTVLVVPIVVAALALAVWFLLALAGCRHLPWLQDVEHAPGGPIPSR
jgi:hypothetical protein